MNHAISQIDKINQLHNQAMDIAEQASVAKWKKASPEELSELYKKSYKLEKQAAQLIQDCYEEEPFRGIVFQSAAYAAFNAGMYREAEKMVNSGLAGDPPSPIYDNLLELFFKLQSLRKTLKHSKTVSTDTIVKEIQQQPMEIQLQVYNYLRFLLRQPAV